LCSDRAALNSWVGPDVNRLNLDKALELADRLEAGEIASELERRK
jgi:hypothetical protein